MIYEKKWDESIARIILSVVEVMRMDIVMDKILNLDNTEQHNLLYGLETLHPLVNVVNLNETTCAVDTIRLNYGVYALLV